MRSRSITGPLILVALGVIFLLNNIWQNIPLWSLFTEYWPLILIAIGLLGLIEVLYHVSRGTAYPPRPVGIGNGFVWLLVILMLFVWGGTRNGIHIGRLDAGGVTMLGTDYTYDINARNGTDSIARVVFDNVHGNVSVKGSDDRTIQVNGHNIIRAFSRSDADRANEQSQIHIVRQGDLLIVRSDEPRSMRMLNISTDITVAVPKNLSVETRGRSGDITIDGLDGAVEIASSRGDIRVSNIGRDVKVESSNRGGLIRATGLRANLDVQGRGEDIQAEDIKGQVTVTGEFGGTIDFQSISKSLHFQSSRTNLRASGVPGGVTLDSGEAKLTNLAGPVRLETRDRDVHITDISDSLELNVDRGDVHVTHNKTALPRMEISVRRSGEIDLAVPQSSGFSMNARTGRGEIQNDFGGDLRTESNGRDATLKGRSGTGPDINISTERGNITLRRN